MAILGLLTGRWRGKPGYGELRPLIDAVPDHQERVLQDDATIMLLG